MPRRFPKHLPLWIPTPDGLQETRAPFRTVPAAVLQSINLGMAWQVIHRVEDRKAFFDAWLAYALRRLKVAKASAAATRGLEVVRSAVGVAKPTKGIRARKRVSTKSRESNL